MLLRWLGLNFGGMKDGNVEFGVWDRSLLATLKERQQQVVKLGHASIPNSLFLEGASDAGPLDPVAKRVSKINSTWSR